MSSQSGFCGGERLRDRIGGGIVWAAGAVIGGARDTDHDVVGTPIVVPVRHRVSLEGNGEHELAALALAGGGRSEPVGKVDQEEEPVRDWIGRGWVVDSLEVCDCFPVIDRVPDVDLLLEGDVCHADDSGYGQLAIANDTVLQGDLVVHDSLQEPRIAARLGER